MEKLSKGFYLGSVAGGSGLAIILSIVGTVKREMAIVSFGLIPEVYWLIVGLVLLYRAWASIQDGHARTTPGKAVGFLFIPLYDFYWIFQAFWGFAKDYNSYIARHGITTSRLSEGLFLSLCILTLIGVFLGVLRDPFLLGAFLIVSFVIDIVIVNKVCDAVNSLS